MQSKEQAAAVFEAFYPYRHFPELRQSLKSAAASAGCRQQEGLPALPGMEYKVHSFARTRSTRAAALRPVTPAAPPVTPSAPFKYNEERIYGIQKKMSRLQRSSCLDEMDGLGQGLGAVRRVILRESNAIRRSMQQLQEARPRASG